MEEMVSWLTTAGPVVRDLGIGTVAIALVVFIVNKWIAANEKREERDEKEDAELRAAILGMKDVIATNTTAITQLAETTRATGENLNQLTVIVSALTQVIAGCRHSQKGATAKKPTETA